MDNLRDLLFLTGREERGGDLQFKRGSSTVKTGDLALATYLWGTCGYKILPLEEDPKSTGSRRLLFCFQIPEDREYEKDCLSFYNNAQDSSARVIYDCLKSLKSRIRNFTENKER